MKIFFHAAINESDQPKNQLYYDYIKESGHTHTTDFAISHNSKDMTDPNVRKKAKDFLDKQEDAIRKADVVILGATSQSIGTGVYLHISMHLSKPIIALCEDRNNIPFLYEAVDYNKLIILECNANNYQKVLHRALSKAEKIIDKRFTLLLPPDVVEMLDNHYERTGETRSEYIRNLIKDDQAQRALQPPTRYLAPSE